MSRYNSKKEKKRGTEKVGILDLTDSILIQNVRNSFFALSVGFPNSNARTVLNLGRTSSCALFKSSSVHCFLKLLFCVKRKHASIGRRNVNLKYIKVHTATRWTIRHSQMLHWFADLMNVTEEVTIHRPNVSTLLSSAFIRSDLNAATRGPFI